MTDQNDSRGGPRQLEGARAVARLLDRRFRVPGTPLRFGLDPILGLIPGAGDVVGAVGSAYILYVAWLNGAPGSMIARMMLNVLVDALVGSVPVIGDLFDAGWQANARNVSLLERWLASEGTGRHHSVAILVGVVAALIALLAAVVALLWWITESLLQGAISGAANLF